MTEPTRGGTRERIQQVALDLFAEQGYDKTSLREIADRLGVTKAALYYHYKTKEDILTSALEDYMADVRELIGWAEQQPRTGQMRRELIRRYARIIDRRLTSMRFVQSDQKGVQQSEVGERFHGWMADFNRLLTPEGGDLVARVRALGAVITLHAGILFLAGDPGYDLAEVRAAATTVAEEIIAANDS
jgi:AcrR family transcriptional regulator